MEFTFQQDSEMKAIAAIILALLFLLPFGCSRKATKSDESKLEEPKNDKEEVPPWSKFPFPEDKEKEEDEE
jgi:hypothetical protein